MMLCRRAEPLPIEVIVRGYLAGSGWKDYRPDRRRLRDPAAGRACARATACRSRSSRPRRRPRSGHDENIDLDEAARARRRATWPPRRRATLAIALYRLGAGGRRAGRDHPRRHEVRVRDRPRDRRAAPDRRGPDARLVAVLGRVGLRAGPGAGELRQAVRPRLARDAGVGQDAARPGAAGRRRRRDARPLRRGVRADHRRELRALPRRGHVIGPMSDGLPVRGQRQRRRPGSSIPRAGRSRAASAISGSTACRRVRVGRRVELTVDGRRRGGGARGRRAARRASCSRTR